MWPTKALLSGKERQDLKAIQQLKDALDPVEEHLNCAFSPIGADEREDRARYQLISASLSFMFPAKPWLGRIFIGKIHPYWTKHPLFTDEALGILQEKLAEPGIDALERCLVLDAQLRRVVNEA